MFPNLLSSSVLTWAGLFSLMVALPLLIHLINMLRHRRVRWAAMEFVLQSYQRNRNWIWLKQLILLLARIAALVGVLLMAAQIGCENDELAELQGRPTTHHYLILDDSFSMAERDAGQRLFDRAITTNQTLAARAGHRQNQKLTLLRYSEAAFSKAADDSMVRAEEVADLAGIDIDSGIGARLEETQSALDVSDLAVGPEAALELVESWLVSKPDEQAIVYVISDFRAKDWTLSTAMSANLQRIRRAGGRVHLVNCVRSTSPNLAIVDLAPVSGMSVADVPMYLRLTIRNLGEEPAHHVQVNLSRELYAARDASRHNPGRWEPDQQDLQAAFFEEIGPNSEASQEIPIFLPMAGHHVVTATLEDDALTADNVRQCIIGAKPFANVLVIEDGAADNAYYLQTAFSPGRRNTGFQSSLRNSAELERMTLDELATFDVLVLVDPIRLRQSAVQRLEAFVDQGGGLVCYLGPGTDIPFVNSALYAEGQGLLPMPVDEAIELPELIDETAPDIVPTSHPLFRPLTDPQTSLLPLVTLSRYMRPPPGWETERPEHVEVYATIRDANGDPLILGQRYGRGKVAMVSTSLGPQWHDWTSNPAFVVCTLFLQESMVEDRYDELNQQVGSSFVLPLDNRRHLNDVLIRSPSEAGVLHEVSAIEDESDPQKSIVRFGLHAEPPLAEVTSKRGVYEVWLTTQSDQSEVVRWATHVDPAEGQLKLAAPDDLRKRYASARPKVEFWDEVSSDPRSDLGSSLSKWLIILVVTILIGEQILAYMTSYHPPRRGAGS